MRLIVAVRVFTTNIPIYKYIMCNWPEPERFLIICKRPADRSICRSIIVTALYAHRNPIIWTRRGDYYIISYILPGVGPLKQTTI